MLIDLHVHTCRPRPIGRVTDRNFIEPEALIAALDANGIDKALVLCVMSPECRGAAGYLTSEETLEVCAQYPDRLIPSCSFDCRMVGNSPKSDFRPMLAFYKQAGCKAVGEYMPNLPFDEPIQMNFFRQVAEVGLPLTFHIGPTLGGCYGCYDDLGLPRLEKVLKECPNLTLVGHSQPFWSEISADVTEATRGGYPEGKVTPGRLVRLMREYPNLWADLSAGSGFNAIRRDPEFGYAFLEEFQDRLCFGTDLAWAEQDAPIAAYFQKLRADRLISPEAWGKITWENADRLLGLGLQQS